MRKGNSSTLNDRYSLIPQFKEGFLLHFAESVISINAYREIVMQALTIALYKRIQIGPKEPLFSVLSPLSGSG